MIYFVVISCFLTTFNDDFKMKESFHGLADTIE